MIQLLNLVMLGPQKQISKTKPENWRMRDVENLSWHVKPAGGLWTSTEATFDTDGWGSYIATDYTDWRQDGMREWRLIPNEPVIQIASYRDLERVVDAFGITHETSNSALSRKSINFEAMAAAGYAGLNLTAEGQWATRLSSPLSLYGWDCESTVWFRWAFDRVEEILPDPRTKAQRFIDAD